MRPENNPLDLNNLPEDYSKQVLDESSSTGAGAGAGHRKKKSGAKDGKDDECGKVYECRFCTLKFCKSQALGGHMNRHRQERETETLNKARQLVFQHNDNLAVQGPPPHLGCHPMTPGSYHPAGHIGDPFRSIYPPRLYSAGSSSTLISPPPPPPQPPQYPYPSSTSLTSCPSHQYPPHQPMNELYVGHVLSSSPHSQYPHNQSNLNNFMDSSYTCIGAPVGHGFVAGSSRGSDMAGSSSVGRDGSLSNQDQDGLSWGRSYAPAAVGGGSQQRSLDHPSSINRFQDGF
ncbi:hypothetical protein AB3S75_008925 [Citrus x aurantiifolia]